MHSKCQNELFSVSSDKLWLFLTARKEWLWKYFPQAWASWIYRGTSYAPGDWWGLAGIIPDLWTWTPRHMVQGWCSSSWSSGLWREISTFSWEKGRLDLLCPCHQVMWFDWYQGKRNESRMFSDTCPMMMLETIKLLWKTSMERKQIMSDCPWRMKMLQNLKALSLHFSENPPADRRARNSILNVKLRLCQRQKFSGSLETNQ